MYEYEDEFEPCDCFDALDPEEYDDIMRDMHTERDAELAMDEMLYEDYYDPYGIDDYPW